jgi:hypothetical protein
LLESRSSCLAVLSKVSSDLNGLLEETSLNCLRMGERKGDVSFLKGAAGSGVMTYISQAGGRLAAGWAAALRRMIGKALLVSNLMGLLW